jgi:hypothetical protein
MLFCQDYIYQIRPRFTDIRTKESIPAANLIDPDACSIKFFHRYQLADTVL